MLSAYLECMLGDLTGRSADYGTTYRYGVVCAAVSVKSNRNDENTCGTGIYNGDEQNQYRYVFIYARREGIIDL